MKRNIDQGQSPIKTCTIRSSSIFLHINHKLTNNLSSKKWNNFSIHYNLIICCMVVWKLRDVITYSYQSPFWGFFCKNIVKTTFSLSNRTVNWFTLYFDVPWTIFREDNSHWNVSLNQLISRIFFKEIVRYVTLSLKLNRIISNFFMRKDSFT